jgi:YceI-like domain
MRKFLWPVALLLAACAAPPREPPVAAPPQAPLAAALPSEHWAVTASYLEVRVYRDGPMQKLGHNHIITSSALEGSIELRDPLTKSGFELHLPLESLVVDDPAARSTAGADFVNPVPQKDREGTRRNLLGEYVLDAARQDAIRLTAEELTGEPGALQARVRVSLRGEEHVIAVPFSLKLEGDRLESHASFRLTHADIGLVPFTVALGALKVRDDIEINFRLEARRGA